MKKARKAASIALAALMVLTLAGCWSYTDIEELAVAIGMAIDKTDDGQYLVTVELAHPGGKDEMKSIRAEGKGKTIFDGMRNLSKKLENKAYYSHAQLVILSESIAREGILPVMDVFARNPQLRLTLHVLVSRMPTAKECFEVKGMTTELRSAEIEAMILNNMESGSKAPPTHVYELINMLPEHGLCAALPAVQIVTNAGYETTELAGTAVFHKDRLAGYLDDEETKAYLFVVNNIKGGVLLVHGYTQDVQHADGTLEIIENNTEMKPEYKDGKLSIRISTKTKANIVENETAIKFIREDRVEPFKAGMQADLEQEILHTIQKVQKEYNADIFGFGEAVRRDMPQLWKQIKDQWYEGLFASLPVEVKSKIEVTNNGVLKGPIVGEE